MRQRPRHSPRARALLTLAALGALLVGYYLGQYWQRQPLGDLSAVVYPDGKPIEFPDGLARPDDGDSEHWRLYLVADTTRDRCRTALPRFGLMMNRLAAWPTIQPRVRLTVIAYDAPSDDAALQFSGGAPWIDVISGASHQLDALSGNLGILPDPLQWCEGTQLNSVLVAPDGRRWALIPYEDPQTMAFNVQAVIQFVE
jgi:hypothetical protein